MQIPGYTLYVGTSLLHLERSHTKNVKYSFFQKQGGAQTLASCSLGKHPNHLDHQHHWVSLVLDIQ